MDPDLDQLRKENEYLRHELTNIRLATLETRVNDHDRRLRPIEEAVTKFNFLLFLTAGGGILSFINLTALLYLINDRLP